MIYHLYTVLEKCIISDTILKIAKRETDGKQYGKAEITISYLKYNRKK